MRNKKTAVYRMYDKDRELLYVGITSKLSDRFGNHFKEKTWIDDVQSINITWYANRNRAEVAENTAIRWEHPKHNVKGVIKNTSEYKHLLALLEPFDEQPDDFHKELHKLVSDYQLNATREQLPVKFMTLYEWALCNALEDLSSSDEVIVLECESCVKLGNSWWVQEGHGIVCFAFMERDKDVY
jgi:predicted GIY-YIG superfamily endonuclease